MTKSDERVVAVIHSAEIKRIEGEYGKNDPTLVIVKGAPTVRKWGRISEDTAFIFPNRHCAAYFIGSAGYKLKTSYEHKGSLGPQATIIVEE